ncbi:von Willebrand factor, partial [Ophiophagus hannah]
MYDFAGDCSYLLAGDCEKRSFLLLGILEENIYSFANSWGMSNQQKKCQRVMPPSYTCNISSVAAEKKNHRSSCFLSLFQEIMDCVVIPVLLFLQDFIKNCQLLRTSSVFSKCHHLVDPEKFIGLCEEDMCRCAQDRNCHCPVFLEYARNCAQQGVILKGWPASSACIFAGMERGSATMSRVQCADDRDAVCTRSVSVQLQDENLTIKLKHGGGVSVNGQDIQIPFLQTRYAESSCSLLLSPLFEPCHHEVSSSPYLKNCRYDVCSCSDGKDCLCTAVSAYAMACARKGVVIDWRKPDFCAMSCPEGQLYQQCGSPCNQTCRSLSHPDTDCHEFCTEGCFCPTGTYLDQQGDCVPRSQCSCYYDGEIFQPDDVFSDHHTMWVKEVKMATAATRLNAFMIWGLQNYLMGSETQSCENMNKVEEEYQCEWRYNSCGPACPRTCQHMDPIACPVKCVEGCHPHCPAGKILDELSESCIKLEECPVCEAEGRRISHGKKIILNSENPQLCQSCPDEEDEEEEEEITREYSCSKMMDLAILMDGSNKLSESDFDELKNFIISVMEKLHITQKRIRLAVLEYRTGSHIYLGLKDVKKSTKMRKIVQNIKYTGGDVASATEVLKYVLFHVFGKAPRENVARIAMLLMASKDPKRIQGIFPLLKKKKIIVIPIGLGPHVSTEQIGLIERQSPENRAFLMNSVLELRQRKDEIIDYFCGLVPEVSAVLTTRRPIPTVPSVEARTYLPHGLTKVPSTEMSISIEKVLEIVFLVEGSHNVGKSNFDTIKEFLVRTIQELKVGEETIYISILQYSFTITVEHSFQERQSKEFLIKKVREMKFQGGNATNTGQALNFVTQQSFTTNRRREQVPHLVYMVTANPATDIITRPPKDVHVIPIGIRPNADIQELQELSQPQAPIIIEGFNNLIKEGPDLVFKTCCSKKETCTKPMDVIFLLDGTSDVEEAQFEEMKRFVKAFIEHADVGHFSTQVAVLQYGKVNSLEISWNAFQEEANLLKKVDSIHQREKGPSKLVCHLVVLGTASVLLAGYACPVLFPGEAIDFMVQHAISEANGGRPNASKTAVVIVAGTSRDAVEAAAYSARSNSKFVTLPLLLQCSDILETYLQLVGRVSLLPIGVGTKYNAEQLNALMGPSAKDTIIKLQRFEDLSTMITLDDEFMKKLCTGKPHISSHSVPGDKWQLLDQCYSVTCLPGGHTELKSHRHLCEKMAKPTCHNNFPAVKVEETCGCRWTDQSSSTGRNGMEQQLGSGGPPEISDLLTHNHPATWRVVIERCSLADFGPKVPHVMSKSKMLIELGSTCMGSSTRHIVTFDGLDFKLTGNCSYTLFEDKEEGIEVTLHNGACSSVPKLNCMNALEVTYQGFSVQLYDNMTVRDQ